MAPCSGLFQRSSLRYFNIYDLVIRRCVKRWYMSCGTIFHEPIERVGGKYESLSCVRKTRHHLVDRYTATCAHRGVWATIASYPAVRSDGRELFVKEYSQGAWAPHKGAPRT